MKKLLLILGISLSLASSVNGLEAGDKHPDPLKVITKGEVIGHDLNGSSGTTTTSFIIEYDNEIYSCFFSTKYYACNILKPITE